MKHRIRTLLFVCISVSLLTDIVAVAQSDTLSVVLPDSVVTDAGFSIPEDLETRFPVILDSVRLSTRVLEFENVHRGQQPEVVVEVINLHSGDYRPMVMHLPSFVSVRCEPEQLASCQTGRIVFTLLSDKIKNDGLTQTTVYLSRFEGDAVCPQNELDLSVMRLPSFAHLTPAQRKTAPHITLSEEQLDFSDMGMRRKASKQITITNMGRRSLHIIRLQATDRTLSMSLSDSVIPPGDVVRLKVTLDATNNKNQKLAPRVLLITDDPLRPKVSINVKK